MSLKSDIKAAKKAQDKLAAYCAGLPKGCEPNRKYYELNSAAHRAINKLPEGIIRTRMGLELADLLLK